MRGRWKGRRLCYNQGMSAAWTEAQAERRYQALLAALTAEFPGFRLVRKEDSLLQRAIHWALCALSLGAMRRYLSDFQTTIGQTVYVTRDWDHLPATVRWATLRHEAVHLRQFRRLTVPGMALLYLLLPLPAGLSYFRMRLERAAYEETLWALAQARGVAAVRADRALRAHIVAMFVGPAYGFMWPFRRSVERWYDRQLERLAQGRRADTDPD